MDALDRAIISHLRQDGRLSNLDLAERIGLSPSPCLRRVRRLEESGVITGYHAAIAPDALSRGFSVHVDIELARQDQASIEEFETALIALDEVIEARRMFGAPDYYALIATADLAAYEKFMTQTLVTLPGLLRMQSRFAMKAIKTDVPLSH